MWNTAFEFILTTSLGFSALLCNKPPESAYSRLQQVGAGDDQEMMSSLLSDGDKTSISETDDVERELEVDRTVGILRGKKSPEERATVFSRLTFSWMNPLLELGVQRPLQEKDLYPLARQDTSKNLGDDLESNWNGLLRSLKFVPRRSFDIPFHQQM
jgi:hypothetical protein